MKPEREQLTPDTYELDRQAWNLPTPQKRPQTSQAWRLNARTRPRLRPKPPSLPAGGACTPGLAPLTRGAALRWPTLPLASCQVSPVFDDSPFGQFAAYR